MKRRKRNLQKQEKEENREGTSKLSRNADFRWQSKKSISSFVESMESGEISASSYEWKTGLDEVFVTCLNDNSDSKTN